MIVKWARLLAVLLTTLGATVVLALVAQPASAVTWRIYSSEWYQPRAYCEDIAREIARAEGYLRSKCDDPWVAGQWVVYVSRT